MRSVWVKSLEGQIESGGQSTDIFKTSNAADIRSSSNSEGATGTKTTGEAGKSRLKVNS